MTRPTTAPYQWATNANFSGGPDVGTPTKAAPSGGLQAEGFEPGQEPGAQNVNELLSNTGLWLQYLLSTASRVQNRSPVPFVSTNWAAAGTASYGEWDSSGVGDAVVDLLLNTGEQLTSIIIASKSAGADLILTVQKSHADGSAPTTMATLSMSTFITASFADYAMNFLGGDTGTQQINAVNSSALGLAPGHQAFVRTSGSWLADGLFEQPITVSGFSAGGLNTGFTVSEVVSATGISTTATFVATETGSGSQRIIAPPVVIVLDNTFNLNLVMNSQATGQKVRALRIGSVIP